MAGRETWVPADHRRIDQKTIADLLAVPAALVFNSGESVSWIATWTRVLAFAGQIYGEFSGYSDMAIGIGLLLGYQFPDNFRLPYLASSPIDFRILSFLTSSGGELMFFSFMATRSGSYCVRCTVSYTFYETCRAPAYLGSEANGT